MLVVQRALRIIIRREKFFRFPMDSERYVQQFITTFSMVFVTPPKIYCGEKTREKNRKFQDQTNHLYISGSNNYFATAQFGTILL